MGENRVVVKVPAEVCKNCPERYYAAKPSKFTRHRQH
ncbi:MAG: YgiT-type zinc finger protein [Actinomycetota bacterium]